MPAFVLDVLVRFIHYHFFLFFLSSSHSCLSFRLPFLRVCFSPRLNTDARYVEHSQNEVGATVAGLQAQLEDAASQRLTLEEAHAREVAALKEGLAHVDRANQEVIWSRCP